MSTNDDPNPRPSKKRRKKTVYSSLKFKSPTIKQSIPEYRGLENGHLSDEDESLERNSATLNLPRAESKLPRNGNGIPAPSTKESPPTKPNPQSQKPTASLENTLKFHLLDLHVTPTQAQFYTDIYGIDLLSFIPPTSIASLVADLRHTGRGITDADLSRPDLEVWSREVIASLYTAQPVHGDAVGGQRHGRTDRDYAVEEGAYNLLDELRDLEARRRDRVRRDVEGEKERWPALWESYVSRWEMLSSGNSDFEIPWPTESLEQVNLSRETIRAFFNGVANWKARQGGGARDVLKAMLKGERVRWHPDKVAQRVARGEGKVSREVLEKVTMVFQVIDDWYGEMK